MSATATGPWGCRIGCWDVTVSRNDYWRVYARVIECDQSILDGTSGQASRGSGRSLAAALEDAGFGRDAAWIDGNGDLVTD